MPLKIWLVLAILLIPLRTLATSPEDYYNAGVVLFKNHDYEKAIKYFHAAVEERPDYWQAYESLGMAYYQNGDVTASIMAVELSLKLHSDNPSLRKFLSNITATSPWASRGFMTGALPLITFLLALLNTAAIIWYWRRRSRYTPPKT